MNNDNLFNYNPNEKITKEFNSTAALNEFEKISQERKQSVLEGETPEWAITAGYMMFKKRYSFEGETMREAYKRVAELGKYYKPNSELARQKFFDLMWRGFLAPSTPVLANVGLDRGDAVSCSGGYVPDSVKGFYHGLTEAAILSQRGYGTSGYLGDIRPRGTPISKGGKASGVVPVFEDFNIMSNKISQGNTRRGQWAGYLPIMHGDFYELWDHIFKNSATSNIGWTLSQADIDALNRNDPELIRRFNLIQYLRSRHGKGYIYKPDTANNLAPQAIKNCGIPIVASNLCVEISLPENDEYSFSCVLSSLNLSKWFEFDEDTIFWSLIFLDCVCQQTIEETQGIKEIEKLHNFTKDFRALGLGTLGWHTLLQSLMLPIDSLQAKLLNKQIFKKIKQECLRASRHLAEINGEPKFCKGLGVANATFTAIAPNTSSALLCGGVSQGIEPIVANVYNQNTAAGEVTRMNPLLLKYLKENNLYSEKLLSDIAINYQGSIQHIRGIPEDVKRVFATAYEIDQYKLIDLAADRQPELCQSQSLNLFFTSESTEQDIAAVTKYAINHDNIVSLYYQRGVRSVRGSSGECVACEA